MSDAAPATGTLRTRRLERCLACGGGRLRTLPMRYEYRGAGFPLAECRDCGMRFLAVQPVGESLAGLYDEPYFQADYRCGRATTSSFEGETFAAESRGQVDAFEARTRPGRLLEVGCASGWLLRHAAERGWSVMGVEPSPAAAAFARSLGLDVFEGALEEARLPDARFDVVYMGDVLEHVPDCRATLLEVARVLAPGGWLFLRGPITTHSVARALALRLYGLLGREIVLREPPYHLWEFRPRPLSRLVRSVGLEPHELRQSKIPPGRTHGAKTGLQRAAMGALDVVNVPLTRVLNARGDRATLVARKPAPTPR